MDKAHQQTETMPAKERRFRRRRGEVIDAAAAVFAEKGYHGASTKDIADRLGIRQGSLYYYFSSKEAALGEVCAIGVDSFVQRIGAIAAGDQSAADKVRAAVANHLDPLRDRRDYVRVFLNDRQELPADSRHRIGRMTRRYEALVEGILREGVRRGEFRRDLDCRLAALALIGLCNSVLVWYGRRIRSVPLERIAEAYAALFLSGVAAPAEGK